MAIIQNPVTPSVLGQQISGDFSKQFSGVQAVGAPLVNPVPLAATIGGTNKTLLESCARGELPRNANVASVAGVAPAVGISNTTGDTLSVDEAMSNGNGAQVNLGVAVAGTSDNPNAVTTAGINDQIFVSGALGPANISQGPTPTNSETLTSAPTPASMTTANVSLVSNSFAG